MSDYPTASPVPAKNQIVLLEHGVVLVGYALRYVDGLVIKNTFGLSGVDSSGGLGRIARHGPQPQTHLEWLGEVFVPPNRYLLAIDCDAAAWNAELLEELKRRLG